MILATTRGARMANMSYCRWQNTAADLADCAADLEARMADCGASPLSRDESEARRRLFETAALMLAQIGVEVDMNDVIGAVQTLDDDGT